MVLVFLPFSSAVLLDVLLISLPFSSTVLLGYSCHLADCSRFNICVVAVEYRGLLLFGIGLVTVSYRGLLLFGIGLVAVAYRGLLIGIALVGVAPSFRDRPCTCRLDLERPSFRDRPCRGRVQRPSLFRDRPSALGL